MKHKLLFIVALLMLLSTMLVACDLPAGGLLADLLDAAGAADMNQLVTGLETMSPVEDVQPEPEPDWTQEVIEQTEPATTEEQMTEIVEDTTEEEQTTEIENDPDVVYSQGLAYRSNGDGTCVLTGLGTCQDSQIVIPKVQNGEIVVEVAERAFRDHTHITSLIIPGTITIIGEEAFYGCTSLQSVSLAEGIITLDSRAFAVCKNLKAIEIPNSVETIGIQAFMDCTSLANIVMGSGVTTIKSHAFERCRSLTHIELPDSITTMEQGAFIQCSGLTEITIPKGVTVLSHAIFWNCDNLSKVTIYSSLTSYDTQPFNSQNSLTDVYYGGTTTQWELLGLDKHLFNVLGGFTIHYITTGD